ncbi:hypothetical protein DH2020_021306 [Rehmannia glutinosa]|uniref:Uncharacterized protein n=1 Tax=Rehmannia glutinosa TaxID=99300 RepID=A0ABR0WA17_REHGL
MKGLYKDSGNGFMEFYKREMGLCPTRNYSRRVSASQTLIEHIDLYGKLNGHKGCVNTVAFTSTGEILLSGSNDLQIMLWDWATEKLICSYPFGHFLEILQARFMPLTDDCKIVTSSADCQVRLIMLKNGSVETKKLSEHEGSVHSLAVEPGNPYVFYSCGEDGFVQHYDLRSCSATELFNCASFEEPPWRIGMYSIVIDPRNPNYFAVGGADPFARVFDIRKYQVNASTKVGTPVNTFCPHHLIATNNIITSLAYSSTSELLASYSHEFIYLFQKNMGWGANPLHPPHVYPLCAPCYTGHKNSLTIKGVNFFGPNDEYVVSGSDCGYIFIWKKRGSQLVRSMIGDIHTVNQLERHPLIPILATCGIENDIKIWGPSSNSINPLPANELEVLFLLRQLY